MIYIIEASTGDQFEWQEGQPIPPIHGPALVKFDSDKETWRFQRWLQQRNYEHQEKRYDEGNAYTCNECERPHTYPRDMKIGFIKHLRDVAPLSLKEAKDIADKQEPTTTPEIHTCYVCYPSSKWGSKQLLLQHIEAAH